MFFFIYTRMMITKIIAYVLIIVLAIFLLWLDRQDWECPDLYSARSECEGGIGMPIRDTRPSDSDGVYEMLDKINRASQSERKNIKWRKSMYLSIFLTFVIFLLVATPGKLPPWPSFYCSVGVMFGILYIHYNWYSYHRYSYAEKHTRENVEKLKNVLI